MSPTELIPARPVLWPLRPAESAKVSLKHSGSRVVVTIEHAPLADVTPEMLAWWYGHVPGNMRYAGTTYPRYLVWHPLDHISYEVVRPGPGPAVGPGTELHIVEALGRNLDHLVDIRVTVEDVSESGAVIVKRILGSSAVRLENLYAADFDGARYVSRMRLGDDTLAGRLLLNLVARRRAFPPEKLTAWTRHHIEEIGNLENFLPALFRDQTR
ncbi:MAG: hypothetical protein ACRDP9_03655 [Kribbellaceae bacterium]